jgi:hypothetical protein
MRTKSDTTIIVCHRGFEYPIKLKGMSGTRLRKAEWLATCSCEECKEFNGELGCENTIKLTQTENEIESKNSILES